MRVATSITIGVLAAKDLVSGPVTGVSTSSYRIMSVDFNYALSDLGATADDGQEFGLAHSDYTDTEIEQCIEVSASVDVSNKTEQEQANRLVRIIGNLVGAPGTGAGLNFNDGRPMKTRLNWGMGIGQNLVLWIRNFSGTVYTTGATLDIVGNMWVKDSV